jgi:hypothetical protein
MWRKQGNRRLRIAKLDDQTSAAPAPQLFAKQNDMRME